MEGWTEGRRDGLHGHGGLGESKILPGRKRERSLGAGTAGALGWMAGLREQWGCTPATHTSDRPLHHLHLHLYHLLLLKHECYEIVLDAAPLAALVLRIERFSRDQLLLKRRKMPFSVKIRTFI